MRPHHAQVCCPRGGEAEARRLTRLGFEPDRREWATFPGYRRVHADDAPGNRVELLA